MKELKVISLYFFLIVNLFSGLHLEAKSIVSGDIVEGQAYQPNFLKQKGHFEKNANGTTAYADAAGTRPVDGSGGAPTLSCTRTTSSPIDGDGSLLITKDAANRQGNGCTIQFTIDSAYKAKVLQIEFDYLVASGTFTAGSSSADSDLIVYIYDVTNSTLIEPSSIKLLSNSSTISDHFVANFQTSATGTTYNLILHQATTSASAYTVKADNFEVKPSKYVYGTPISDWVSYTPTITGLGTPASQSFYTRRVGDSREIKFILTAGTTDGSIVSFTLPNNESIDSNKISPSTVVGKYNANTATWNGGIFKGASNSLVYFGADGTAYTSGYAGNNFANGTTFGGFFEVPITGWSSSVQVSDGYDGRQIGTRVYLDGGTTVTSGSAFIFTSKSHDKTNSYDTSNGRFTAPSQGLYEVSALITYASSAWTAGNTNNLQLYKNGSFHSFIDANDATSTASYVFAVRGTAQIELNAGDYLTIIPSFTGSRSSISNAGLNWASFKKLSSPQTMSATEKLVASYGDSSGQSITGSNQIIGFNTLTEDTHNIKSGTGTSTQFIIPYQGSFRIFTQLQTGATTSSGNQYFIPKIYIDGSPVAEGGNRFPTSHISPTGTVEWTGPLNAGQIVTIRLDTDVAASRSLSSSAASNRMSIIRIK